MASPVKRGDKLAGKYEVERVLGEGGMGVVVSARHMQLGEHVAIKFLLPQALASKEVVARFVREGRASARIKSEHVARVFDVGTLDGGEPYLVMEYLEGSDLRQILKKGPLPLEAAVDYVLQACEALADAHALGIIHRDLKPGNLILTHRSDGTACIKLIDFGISKVMGAKPTEGDVEMTATAVIMGSPLYMSPEQMTSAREVDARSDVWSLGAILYALLTGGPPFRGSNVMQIYDRILKGAPRVRSTLPDVPEAIENAVLRCLEKDRDARYANVAELASAIAPYAPEQTRISATRAARILGLSREASGPGSGPQSAPNSKPPGQSPSSDRGMQREGSAPIDVTPGVAQATSSRESGASASMLEKDGAGASNPPRPVAESPTDAPWSQIRRPDRRSRTLALVGVCGALVVGGIFGLRFFVNRAAQPVNASAALTDANAPLTPTASASAAVASQAASAAGAPQVAPASPASSEPVPAPAAPAEASTSAQAIATARPKPHAAAPKPAAQKRDLFSDPR